MLAVATKEPLDAGAATQTQILIVEDERIVALNLRMRLAKLGYGVTAMAASGAQALSEIQKRNPCLILMDIHIDGDIDGIETAKLIPSELRIPVIYLTAYSEDATLARARTTQPYGYLLKPFSDRELHATVQMVLERRKIDMAQHKSWERLNLALDAGEMSSWEVDPATRTVLHMDKADRIFGRGQNIFAGPWDAVLKQVHDDDRPLVDAMLEQASSGGGASQVEFRRPGQGQVRWIMAHCRQFAGDANDTKRIIGVMQDVTKIHEERELLRKTTTELVAQRERLSTALASANTANSAKSDFLAVMSHELRTPMNAILGFGQLLNHKAFGVLNKVQREYVGYILDAGGHLLSLINDLLDLGKIEAVKLEVMIERVELAPLLGRITASLAGLAHKNKIAIVTEIHRERGVAADATRLRQVLSNLVSNAIKYSRSGGQVRISDETLAEGRVRITIADTGNGIPKDRQGEVFEPFNRLGAELGAVEGTGIGLLITKRLVEVMGGNIGFESLPGVGTRFWIDLPAHAAESLPAQHDFLTGLPNGDLLNDRIGQAIALAPRHASRVAVLSLHLDGLNHINDSLGHLAGDQVLQSAAKRLVDCVRRSDTVSRQAEGRFVVLLPEIKEAEDLPNIMGKMLRAVAEPHPVDRHDLCISASIGVSIYPEDGLNAETLIEAASARASAAFVSASTNTKLPASFVRDGTPLSGKILAAGEDPLA